MTTNCVSRSPVHTFLTIVVLVAAAVLIFAGGNSAAEVDEFPRFYQLAAKTMPRLGRRSGTFEDFFLKASKSVPRIGRRGGYAPDSIQSAEASPWYPRRPTDLSRAAGDDLWSSDKYAREIQHSPELWQMITANAAAEAPTAAGYNEVWQREKRTGNELAEV